jgi:hypothetical protein
MITLRKSKGVIMAPVKQKMASVTSPIYNIRNSRENPFGFMRFTHDLPLAVLCRCSTPLEISKELLHDVELLTDGGKHTQLAADIITNATTNPNFKQWLKVELSAHNISIV